MKIPCYNLSQHSNIIIEMQKGDPACPARNGGAESVSKRFIRLAGKNPKTRNLKKNRPKRTAPRIICRLDIQHQTRIYAGFLLKKLIIYVNALVVKWTPHKINFVRGKYHLACPRSSTDRVTGFEPVDGGSIPSEGTDISI